MQQCLEEALSTLLRTPLEVVGAGRTDAGVHARMMVAHFDLEHTIPDDLAYKLNRLLPKDIAVSGVERVADDLHARFSATRRTYRYYIHTTKQPFSRHYSAQINYPLDFEQMNSAAAMLLNVSDFAAFSKVHTDVKTTVCTVIEARWVQTDQHNWHFVISANRFLRNMVRAVVGTLLDVGRGRITLEEFQTVIASKNRCAAGDSVPANALFLEEILY